MHLRRRRLPRRDVHPPSSRRVSHLDDQPRRCSTGHRARVHHRRCMDTRCHRLGRNRWTRRAHGSRPALPRARRWTEPARQPPQRGHRSDRARRRWRDTRRWAGHPRDRRTRGRPDRHLARGRRRPPHDRYVETARPPWCRCGPRVRHVFALIAQTPDDAGAVPLLAAPRPRSPFSYLPPSSPDPAYPPHRCSLLRSSQARST